VWDLGASEGAQPVRLAHAAVGDKLVRLREAFDTQDAAGAGAISLAEARLAFRTVAHRDLGREDLGRIAEAHHVGMVNKEKGGGDGGQTPLPLDQVGAMLG
jgi:hypothetical protein